MQLGGGGDSAAPSLSPSLQYLPVYLTPSIAVGEPGPCQYMGACMAGYIYIVGIPCMRFGIIVMQY